MNFNQIERRVLAALELLRIKDFYLLKCDVSERALTHKLAEHLQYVIGSSFNVDCEYNRSINERSNCKKIYVLYENLERMNISKGKKNELIGSIEERFNEMSVFPDIIVHKRGTNLKNLLAIEVKKSTSRVDKEYDYLKLKCYTDMSDENELGYKYGLFIILHTKEDK